MTDTGAKGDINMTSEEPGNSVKSVTVADESSQSIRNEVRRNYAEIAKKGTTSCCVSATSSQTSSCCASSAAAGSTDSSASVDEFAERLGYSPEELKQIPGGANMALSCGNPTAIAALMPGETVLDLGSGGGFDAFLAGPKVGAKGRVIGVDMTPEMLEKARTNTVGYRRSTGLDNVEFRLGEIEHLPVGDASIDVVISNCVINLSTDKRQVWKEIARVLKPGGRVAVSDITLLKPLPEPILNMIAAYVGCIAGAVHIDEYEAMIRNAGLEDVVLTPKREFMDAFMQSEDSLAQTIAEHLSAEVQPRDFVTSVDVAAAKPGGGSDR